jgi:hypothetical protein
MLYNRVAVAEVLHNFKIGKFLMVNLPAGCIGYLEKYNKYKVDGRYETEDFYDGAMFKHHGN